METFLDIPPVPRTKLDGVRGNARNTGPNETVPE